jgi:UDP-N-acetyl-D-galactosamine dehydrogenase
MIVLAMIYLKKEHKIELTEKINTKYDIVILTVSHDNYLKIDFNKILKKNHILYNVKSILPKNISTLRL